MMKSESNLVIEVWEQVRDYLPANRRHDAAVGILRAFTEYGFEQDDLSDIIDEDDILTAAYNDFFDVREDDDEEGDAFYRGDDLPWGE